MLMLWLDIESEGVEGDMVDVGEPFECEEPGVGSGETDVVDAANFDDDGVTSRHCCQ